MSEIPPLPQTTPPPLPKCSLDSKTDVELVKEELAKEHLRLLSWGYYLQGTINAVVVSFLLFHFAIFAIIGFSPSSSWTSSPVPHPGGSLSAFNQKAISDSKGYHSERVTKAGTTIRAQQSNRVKKPPSNPEEFREMQKILKVVAVLIALVILTGWLFSGLTIYAGRCVAKARAALFVKVMAGLNCLFIPYGTILGICTFVVLSRPEVHRVFTRPKIAD
jgi:hypothetical protein